MAALNYKGILMTTSAISRLTSTRASSNAPKVAVLGAAGGIGQPLSLLLKLNPKVAQLALYDLVGTPGVGADLSHIDTAAKVSVHTGLKELPAALKDADIVAIPAGVPRKPGMTRDDLFGTNASVVRDLSKMTARHCPNALIAIITNPINSMVPIACEVYKDNKINDFKRIFGVTTLDILRAQTFVAELKNLDVTHTKIPVICGHSGTTIVPVFSQTKPAVKFTDAEVKSLTVKVQEAGTEVVKAKAGAGSATLAMAVAGARFVDNLLLAIKGQKIVQHAFIKSDAVKGVEYFASALEIGPNGLEKILPTGTLSSFEQEQVNNALPELQKNIEKGVKFIHNKCE